LRRGASQATHHLNFRCGSSSATIIPVATIPQKELRNNVGDVLRRAEAGEELTITVAGRPTARLIAVGRRQWVSGDALRAVWQTPAPRTLASDVEQFPAALADPFAQ
jgi:prevent-host-death family protein